MTCFKISGGSPKTGFQEIEHTADWALRIQGRDLCELMGNAAWGMSHLMVAEPATLPAELEQHFELEAGDAESLLVLWLSELAYWAEVEGVVFNGFEMHQVTPTHLKATAWGSKGAELQKHIKAVTYHNLAVIETESGWETTVVFDV